MSDDVTLTVAAATKERIEALATGLRRSATDVATEELESSLDAVKGYDRLIAERIDEADGGRFASETETENFFARYAATE